MGVVDLIFELHLQNFAKSYNFYRCTTDVIIIFWYLYLCEIQKISVGVLRPYLEVSLIILIYNILDVCNFAINELNPIFEIQSMGNEAF